MYDALPLRSSKTSPEMAAVSLSGSGTTCVLPMFTPVMCCPLVRVSHRAAGSGVVWNQSVWETSRSSYVPGRRSANM